MWRKSDRPDSPNPDSRLSQSPAMPVREPLRGSGERATIGPSIAIQGDVTGEEDLVIQGRIEGKVDLKQHSVTVGKNGRVQADVSGRSIIVEGEVRGNLFGEEQVIVRPSGRVEGNITAPRVSLEDGARFKGSIDMEGRKGRSGGGTRPDSGGPAVGSPSPSPGASSEPGSGG